ncbi:hypothetical protein [Sphingomonas sp. R86520]|uniref:hypothetical protein n=1 Tax=Sphingomonas sp. R86520 TaxID=3093859 RepID=UPI0036D431D6
MKKSVSALLATLAMLVAIPADAQDTRYDIVCSGTKVAAKLTADHDVVPVGGTSPYREDFGIDLDGGTITPKSNPTPVHVSNQASQPPILYVFQVETYHSLDEDASVEFIEFQPDALSIHWSSRAFGTKSWVDRNTWIVDATCKKR